MSFDDTMTWEYRLGSGNDLGPHIVLLAQARASKHDQGANSLTFMAERRGLMKRSEMNALRFNERLDATFPLYTGHLELQGNHAAALLVKGLAERTIVGEAAQEAVWLLFWELVLPTEFADEFHELRDVRERARAETAAS